MTVCLSVRYLTSSLSAATSYCSITLLSSLGRICPNISSLKCGLSRCSANAARSVPLQQHVASRVVQFEVCLEGKVARLPSGGLNELGQYREYGVAHTVDGRVPGDHLQFWHVLSLPTS